MTFAQFSKITGLPRSTLFRLENCEQSITLGTTPADFGSAQVLPGGCVWYTEELATGSQLKKRRPHLPFSGSRLNEPLLPQQFVHSLLHHVHRDAHHPLGGDVIEHEREFLLLHPQPQVFGMGGDGVHVAHIEDEPVVEMSLKLCQVLW